MKQTICDALNAFKNQPLWKNKTSWKNKNKTVRPQGSLCSHENFQLKITFPWLLLASNLLAAVNCRFEGKEQHMLRFYLSHLEINPSVASSGLDPGKNS